MKMRECSAYRTTAVDKPAVSAMALIHKNKEEETKGWDFSQDSIGNK